MKVSELISNNYDKIAATMVEKYRTVLECGGRLEYKVYIWDSGNVECLETTSGSNNYLVSREPDSDLYYVTTVDSPLFDPWDCTPESKPDDDDEREKMEEEIIDWCVSEYEQNMYETMRNIIEEKEMNERLEEEFFDC